MSQRAVYPVSARSMETLALFLFFQVPTMWKVQPLVVAGGCKQGAKYGWRFFYVSNDLIMWGWRPENDSNVPPLPRRLPHTVMISGDKDTWGSSQRSSKWNFNESGRGRRIKVDRDNALTLRFEQIEWITKLKVHSGSFHTPRRGL